MAAKLTAGQTANVGLGVSVQGLSKVSRDINNIGNIALRASFQSALKDAGTLVANDAKARASFSTRIQGSIRVVLTARTLAIRAGGASAPMAITFESLDGTTPYRHPVFARGSNRKKWTWRPQTPRPYMVPALANNQEKVVDMVADGLVKAFTENGWH